VANDRDNDAMAGAGSTGTLQIAQYLLPCDATSIGISRMPAEPTGRPVALFLPGIRSLMNATCLRAVPLTVLFDLLVCELPGHGISGEVDDVSLEGFAREYAALIDRYVPNPRHLWVIGESFGGLLGAVLVGLRPDRIGKLVLLETPFLLTRPAIAAVLSRFWQGDRLPYHRRIYRELFGFDPQDGSLRAPTDFHWTLRGLPADCVILPGSEVFAAESADRPPSQQTDADLAALRTIPRVHVLPRIASAGHCLLLDDPWACVAALGRHFAV
jgi:pimeloyl-ACP methyl ester carboxylesterase